MKHHYFVAFPLKIFRRENHLLLHLARWQLRDRSSTNQLRSLISCLSPETKLTNSLQGGLKVKSEEHLGGPLVINTIQLLAHKRALDRLLEMVDTYKTAVSSGELERMPPLAPPPPMPEVVPFHRSLKSFVGNITPF